MLTLDDLHRGDRNDAGRYRSNKDGHKAFLRAAYHARWTVRLVVEETVKRKPVPDIGRESILILLLRDDLKPGRENMWCLAEPDREYIAKMEDVLATYEKPLDVAEPRGLH